MRIFFLRKGPGFLYAQLLISQFIISLLGSLWILVKVTGTKRGNKYVRMVLRYYTWSVKCHIQYVSQDSGTETTVISRSLQLAGPSQFCLAYSTDELAGRPVL